MFGVVVDECSPPNLDAGTPKVRPHGNPSPGRHEKVAPVLGIKTDKCSGLRVLWTRRENPDVVHSGRCVAKGRELTLEVLWAGFGDVQGHVNWADARVIR